MSRPKARRRRAGSVVELRPGRFQARVTIIGPDGRRSTKSKTFHDAKLAQQWVGDMEVRKAEGEVLGQKWSAQPLLDWLEEFYTVHRLGPKGKTLSRRTCQADLDVVRVYVGKRNPTLAATPLSKLTTDALTTHFRMLAEHGREDGQPLAQATVSRLFRIIRARLAFAVRLGRLKASPVRSDLIPVDGVAKKEQQTLTPEQTRALLDVCEQDKYGAYFATLLWTGCRPGEVAGLTWADVDLERALLTIQRNLVRMAPKAGERHRGTSWTLAPTKTKKPRTVPIPGELVDLLRAHRAKQAAHRLLAGSEFEDHGLVHPTDFGRPVHLDTLAARHFKPLLSVAAAYMLGRELPALGAPSRSQAYAERRAKRRRAEADAMQAAGFPRLSLYGCRHTMATLLLRDNVHPKVVQDRLGHSKISTTLDIYSHISPDIQATAVTALESSLARRPRRVG